MVGVEGVAHAERVSEYPGPDAEDRPPRAGLVKMVRHCGEQQRETEDVQSNDRARHRTHARPLPRREGVADPSQP